MDTSLNAINAKIVETLNSVNAEWSDEARGSSQLSRKQMGWPGLSQTWNRGSRKTPRKKATPTKKSTLLGQEIEVVGNNEYEINLDELGYTISGLPESGVVKVNDPNGILGNLQKGDYVPDDDFDFEVKNGEVFITKDRFAEENVGESENTIPMEQDFRGGDNDPEFEREEREALIQQRKEKQEGIEEQIEREDEQGSGDGDQEFQRQEREAIEEQNRNRQEAIEEQIEREESNRRSFEEAAEPGEIEKLSSLDLEEFESLASNPETKQKFADERARRQDALSDETPTDADSLASNPATLKEMSVYEIAEFITESDNPATRKILTDELDRRVAETNP